MPTTRRALPGGARGHRAGIGGLAACQRSPM